MRSVNLRIRWEDLNGEIHTTIVSIDNLVIGKGAFADYLKVLSRDFSTGLKDSKGQEIYEGDILASRNGTSSQRNGIVEWDSISAKFAHTAIKAAEPVNSLATAASRGKVIGNIYEHPYLLNPTEQENK